MTHVSEKDLHSWILYYTYVVTLNQTEHVLTCVPIFCKAPVGLKKYYLQIHYCYCRNNIDYPLGALFICLGQNV